MNKTQNQNTILTYFLIFVAFLTMLSGCYETKDYTGDGKLTDNGRSAATDRYVLTLGKVDIEKKGSVSYKISNLPASNFVFGFNVTLTNENSNNFNTSAINPHVSLLLEDSHGNILFQKESKLDSWTWSMPSDGAVAFVYGRENSGTYFDSSSKDQYILKFSVITPNNGSKDYSVELLAKSSGWK